MYYRNTEIFINPHNYEVVYYEVFRRSTGRDRGGTYNEDTIIGTVDNMHDAEDICFDLQRMSDKLMELSKGYTALWEEFEELDKLTGQLRTHHRSLNKWEDKFGFAAALEKFSELDPTWNRVDSHVYKYVSVKKLYALDANKIEDFCHEFMHS